MEHSINWKWMGNNYETYKPRKNKKKVFLLSLSFIPFLATPGTNWLYFAGISLLTKFKPLWVYQ